MPLSSIRACLPLCLQAQRQIAGLSAVRGHTAQLFRLGHELLMHRSCWPAAHGPELLMTLVKIWLRIGVRAGLASACACTSLTYHARSP